MAPGAGFEVGVELQGAEAGAFEFEDRMAEKALGKRESVLADLADQKQKAKEYAPKTRSSPQRGGEVL